MDFQTFRGLKGWSLDDAAAAIRCDDDPKLARINGSVIGKHERGLRFPNPAHIARYAEVSEGQVTFADWHRITLNGVVPPRPRGRWKRNRAPAPA